MAVNLRTGLHHLPKRFEVYREGDSASEFREVLLLNGYRMGYLPQIV